MIAAVAVGCFCRILRPGFGTSKGTQRCSQEDCDWHDVDDLKKSMVMVSLRPMKVNEIN